MIRANPVAFTETPITQQRDNVMIQYSVIDVGVIQSVSADETKCDVQMFRKVGDVLATYHDIEILYTGVMDLTLVGSPCLVVRPITPVVSARDTTVSTVNSVHNKAYAKAIPLSFGDHVVKAGYNGEDFQIFTSHYRLAFSQTGIRLDVPGIAVLQASSAGINITTPEADIDIGPTLEIINHGSDNTLVGRSTIAADGTKTAYSIPLADPEEADWDDLDQFIKWGRVDTVTPDGIHTTVVQAADPNDDGAVIPLLTQTVNADGSFSIVRNKNDADNRVMDQMTVGADGVLTLTQMDASQDNTTFNTASFAADGTFSATLGSGKDSSGQAVAQFTMTSDQAGTTALASGKASVTLAETGNPAKDVVTVASDSATVTLTKDASTNKIEVVAGNAKGMFDGMTKKTELTAGNAKCTLDGTAGTATLTSDGTKKFDISATAVSMTDGIKKCELGPSGASLKGSVGQVTCT